MGIRRRFIMGQKDPPVNTNIGPYVLYSPTRKRFWIKNNKWGLKIKPIFCRDMLLFLLCTRMGLFLFLILVKCDRIKQGLNMEYVVRLWGRVSGQEWIAKDRLNILGGYTENIKDAYVFVRKEDAELVMDFVQRARRWPKGQIAVEETKDQG